MILQTPENIPMKFAITASDPFLGVFESLVHAGWQPLKLFTTLQNSKAVIEYAQRLAIDVQFSRMDTTDLSSLAAQGCNMLVVASYDWRIPDWHPYLQYAINFHPSPLPYGRGPSPLIHAILEGRQSWGVTCHKIAPDFDTGEMLDAENFPLTDDESYERINLKSQLAAKKLADRVALNFLGLWNNARPQVDGTYFRQWNNDTRTINFSDKVSDILRKVRAFGSLESLASVNGVTVYVRRAVGWVEVHELNPGILIHRDNFTLLVTAQDGYIGIIEWSLLDQNASIGKIGR